ncbi:MAG: ABC transporter ATP-binding protein [Oscillospiraceae bacterium]|jgi:iron complex transport system ATP-binding protein|nr:ABC transporter ATP-binding protein [Oscillospiraceae bacterium]
MNVSVSGLTFSYGRRRVLDDVSFEAGGGELLCVLGPNGVGKSTLFGCILGLLAPSGGGVLVDGTPVEKIPPRELARKLAFVPQSHAPTFNYTVFDMVLMGTTARVGGISSPGAEQTRVAADSIERVGISHLAERGYMRISGGERQLTLIARALAQQADVIIMDEPTANLDYGNQLRVLKCVKDLVRRGLTVIQSTHNPDHAFIFADRVLALYGGRVAAFGEPASVISEELISSLYGVRVLIRRGENGLPRCEPIV